MLLFSTDTTLSAMKIVTYIQGPSPNRILFRDTKQYAELMDCQTHCISVIHTHMGALKAF